MPRRNTTGSSTSASVVVWDPKPVASASRASAMIEADSTVRKTVARLMASFQISDRVARRFQCSVPRIWAAYGPSGWSPAPPAARAAAPSTVFAAPDAGRALLGSWSAGSIVGLLQVADGLPAGTTRMLQPQPTDSP